MKRNLDKLADEAIDQKDFRLAVRYLYLNCIKRLDIKNIIRYANDKTNYEYLKEIQFSEISRTFKSLLWFMNKFGMANWFLMRLIFSNLKMNTTNFTNP